MIADPLQPARLAVRVGDFQRAAGMLEAADPEARQDAEWLLLSAMTRWRLGNFRGSREAAIAARDGFRTQVDADGEMRAENVAAAGAFALGNLDDAETGFSRAYLLATTHGDTLLAARAANNLGNVAFYRADHDGALAYYRLATAGFERAGFQHGLGEALINQSIVARDAGRMRDALAGAERALAAAERARSTRVIAQAHANIGEARGRLGDPRLGRVHLHRALQLARQESDQLAEVEALRLLANLESQEGALDAAAGFFEQARRIVEGLAHPWARAEVLRDYAGCLARAGNAEQARDVTRAAALAFDEAGATVRAGRLRSPA